MCGIAAILRRSEAALPTSAIEAMTEAVAHRGPDGSGIALFARRPDGITRLPHPGSPWHLALGHQRLAILDLSPDGQQPMAYRDRLWLIHNGEIFNYLEIRAELERAGHTFRSHSDSEVILAAYDEWGPGCFHRFRGMWGLVLIDGRRQLAVLSRDRLGIKPLYLTGTRDLLAVASEIKQFAHLPGMRLEPDGSVVADYLATGYERQGRTLFTGVLPLAPGTYRTVDLRTGRLDEPVSFWSPERVEATIHDPAEAARLLRESLQESVRLHLRSDVPVGCALSGGLDSSVVAACIAPLHRDTGQPFETFSVVFPGSPLDEQDHARRVAEAVASRPHYVVPTAEGFLADLDRWVWIHDEPVGSLAQYSAYALARLTREAGVPVTLNGQGGDEVLAGYWQSYFMHLRGLLRAGRVWRLGRHFLGALTTAGNPELARQLPIMLRRYRFRRRAAARAGLVEARSGGESAAATLDRLISMSEQERRVYEIREQYLPRLLKWDDRNFMAFGVEGRYPFLDHRVIELTLSFAPGALYDRGWTKEPLRRGFRGLVPETVLRRRTKFAFETPQDDWLRGALRPAIETWLRSDAPVWDFVPRAQAERLAHRTWSVKSYLDESAQTLMRLFFTDAWMRRFGLARAAHREERHPAEEWAVVNAN